MERLGFLSPAAELTGRTCSNLCQNETLLFRNGDSMTKGFAVDTLNESLAAAQEALSMWSEAGREEGMAAVRRWFASLLEYTEKADLYMTLRICSDMFEAGFLEHEGRPPDVGRVRLVVGLMQWPFSLVSGCSSHRIHLGPCPLPCVHNFDL